MWLFNTKQVKVLILVATAALVTAIIVWQQVSAPAELPAPKSYTSGQAPKSYTSGQAPKSYTSGQAPKSFDSQPTSSTPGVSSSTPGVFPVGDAEQKINLAVPFAPQAPFANWDQPYQDACEEATLIMVDRYLRGVSLSLEEMDVEILRMVDFQNEQFGFNKDSNIAETARLAEAYFPHLKAEAVYDITVDDVQAVLAKGIPVTVLVDGRKLGNPYYTAPGPNKHALVIKGMVDDKFITNDPGTKRGADFVYKMDTVMNALVDYDGNTPGMGKKAMIIITPAAE